MGCRATDEAWQQGCVARGSEAVPLTEFQRRLLAELAETPNDERYLVGDAAMHLAPNSTRYSDDLDFFHDSEARVASAYAQDSETLLRAGYSVHVQPTLLDPVVIFPQYYRHKEETDWLLK